MTTQTDTTADDQAEYEAEIKKAEYSESQEYEFVADIRVRLRNPDGEDVSVVRTYRARPKYDDLVSAENHVHEHAAYWWPDAYPANGDSPFASADHDWSPVADLDDDDALLEECVESATYDPVAEIDSLKLRNDRIQQKLEGY